MQKRLRRKGWSSKELERLHRARQKARRGPLVRFLDRHMILFVILMALLANSVAAIVLTPVFVSLAGFELFAVVVLLGIGFGFLYENILRDIEDWTHHHYFITVGIVPAIAAMLVIILAEFGNFLIELLALSTPTHPSLILGLVYGLSFLLPLSLTHVHSH
jgi:hypothetical protein